jgi:hypothetical protein
MVVISSKDRIVFEDWPFENVTFTFYNLLLFVQRKQAELY